jgi:hypothetical protein
LQLLARQLTDLDRTLARQCQSPSWFGKSRRVITGTLSRQHSHAIPARLATLYRMITGPSDRPASCEDKCAFDGKLGCGEFRSPQSGVARLTNPVWRATTSSERRKTAARRRSQDRLNGRCPFLLHLLDLLLGQDGARRHESGSLRAHRLTRRRSSLLVPSERPAHSGASTPAGGRSEFYMQMLGRRGRPAEHWVSALAQANTQADEGSTPQKT